MHLAATITNTLPTMNLRAFFVLFFLIALTAIGSVYFHSAHNLSAPDPRMWSETVRTLDRCGRDKHARHSAYTAYAGQAEREELHQEARLFRALALADRIHEENCARTIRRMGGRYAPPRRISLLNGKTDGNLRRSAEREELHARRAEADSTLRRLRQSAEPHAARVLDWIAESHTQHAHLLRAHIEQPESIVYGVCPQCGSIYDMERCSDGCGRCHTDRRALLRPQASELHQPVPNGIDHQRGRIAASGLFQNIGAMLVDRPFRDEEPVGDLLVREPAADLYENFGLARR